MNTKKIIRDVASHVMSISERRGYGLGECGYYFETLGFEALIDAADEQLSEKLCGYEIDTGDGINWGEQKRLQAEEPEAYKVWREIVTGAKNMADTLDEMGITRIN